MKKLLILAALSVSLNANAFVAVSAHPVAIVAHPVVVSHPVVAAHPTVIEAHPVTIVKPVAKPAVIPKVVTPVFVHPVTVNQSKKCDDKNKKDCK